MKMSDLRALEKVIKIAEAHKRLERDEIKGLTLNVVFEGGGRGGPGQQDVPVQMFIPFDSPEFQTIFPIIEAKVSEGKAAADTQMAELKSKLSV